MDKDTKYIVLPNGDYIQIKFESEGIVYDRFNKDDEHQESYGYDFYTDIANITFLDDIVIINKNK